MDQQVPALTLLRDYAPPGRNATRAGPRWATALLVAAGHVAVIVAATLVLPRRTPAPAPELAIPVVFQPPAPPAPASPPQTLAAATLPTPSATLPDTLSAIPKLNLPADPHALLPRITPRRTTPHRAPPLHAPPPDTKPPPAEAALQAPPALQAAPSTTPAAAPHQAAPPAPAPGVLQAWEARVHQAVQQALVYPNAARLMRREGRTRVHFDYARGAVSSVAVAQSSGLAAFDRAAQDAVTRAAIPPPPAEIAEQARSMILSVNFTLTSED